MPIHLATRSGQVNIINALVNEYGVDPNSKVRKTSFYLATFNNLQGTYIYVHLYVMHVCTYVILRVYVVY